MAPDLLGGLFRFKPCQMPTYKLAAREGDTRRPSTVVRIGDFARIGEDAVTLIAGPCSVEGREMLLDRASD